SRLSLPLRHVSLVSEAWIRDGQRRVPLTWNDGVSSVMTSQANVTPLDAFLEADDLDDLLRVRHEISTLTPAEVERVASVLGNWTDRQAVANLLFYSTLIPASLRWEALDRGLHSSDIPYFVLTATVGLQAVGLNEVPDDKRAAWLQTLRELVRSK